MSLPTAVNLHPALSHLPILPTPRPSYTQPQEGVSKGAGEGSKVKKSLPFDHQIVWTSEWKFKALPSTMLISFQTCLPFPDINPLLYWNWTTHHFPNPRLCCLHVIRTLNPSPQKSRVQIKFLFCGYYIIYIVIYILLYWENMCSKILMIQPKTLSPLD